MLSGAAVPPELLYPIKNTLLGSAACYHHQPYHHHCQQNQPAMMQSGYWGRNGVDPEPGRCRRTDGKKWRCSRDVVVGYKYCERHLNRGRNRSRKPVEIPTPTSTGGVGCGLNPTSIAASSLTEVANGSHFALCRSSPSIDLLHLNHRSVEGKAGNGDLGLESGGASGGEGRPVERGVLRHFFDDWPRLHQHHGDPNIPTCLSISIPGNGNGNGNAAPSSDFSLKLSTGDGDDEAEAGCSDVGVTGEAERQLLHDSNWSMEWGSYPGASVGGPLAEAFR